jgi:hypothetical protein
VVWERGCGGEGGDYKFDAASKREWNDAKIMTSCSSIVGDVKMACVEREKLKEESFVGEKSVRGKIRELDGVADGKITAIASEALMTRS